MHILLTNDDGVYAPGLLAMRKELQKLGEVTVVAPATEQSATGHSITLLTPLIVNEVYDDRDEPMGWAVEGKPADCVKLALVELLRARRVRVTASLERNVGTNFRESLKWLADGGLIERLHDSDGVVLHVPAGKRVNLDFYKNNTIHFFLVPSLLTRALLAGVPPDALATEIAWWLDLYRWEFPLPERGEALAADVSRWTAWYRERGALAGETLVADHPIVRATEGILENFREAYVVAARTIAGQKEWPIARPALLQRMRRQFQTSLLLGEAQKPEGNNVILFGNALTRLAELEHVELVRRGRERWIDRGPAFETLPELLQRFGALAPRERVFVDCSAGTQ